MQATVTQIARMFGCTEDQIRAQFAKNSKQLAGMASKAERYGRKVNGFSAKQLREMSIKQGSR